MDGPDAMAMLTDLLGVAVRKGIAILPSATSWVLGWFPGLNRIV